MKKISWKEVLLYKCMWYLISFFICQLLNVSFNVSYFSLSSNVTTLLMLLEKKKNKNTKKQHQNLAREKRDSFSNTRYTFKEVI